MHGHHAALSHGYMHTSDNVLVSVERDTCKVCDALSGMPFGSRTLLLTLF